MPKRLYEPSGSYFAAILIEKADDIYLFGSQLKKFPNIKVNKYIEVIQAM